MHLFLITGYSKITAAIFLLQCPPHTDLKNMHLAILNKPWTHDQQQFLDGHGRLDPPEIFKNAILVTRVSAERQISAVLPHVKMHNARRGRWASCSQQKPDVNNSAQPRDSFILCPLGRLSRNTGEKKRLSKESQSEAGSNCCHHRALLLVLTHTHTPPGVNKPSPWQ